MEVQVGLHDAGENDDVAKLGSPEAENETFLAAPRAKVAVIEFVAEEP